MTNLIRAFHVSVIVRFDVFPETDAHGLLIVGKEGTKNCSVMEDFFYEA